MLSFAIDRFALEMDTDCYQCSKPIKSLEYMECSFCSDSAHLKCVGLKRSNMDFLNEQNNALWFCDNCFTKIESLKNNSPITCNEIVTGVSEAIEESLAELKNDIHKTKELTESLVGKVQRSDTPGANMARSAWPSIKRTRTTAKDTPTSRPDVKLIVGTKSVEKDSCTVETVAKPPERFWIYLSRIARHVTEDDVMELVKQCLQIQDSIVVRKLVRKGADLQQMAFISFKVGVDMKLKNDALNPSVWPKGIYFREFENLSSERDFWGPAKIPRIDDGTPSVSRTLMVPPSASSITTPPQ